MPSARSATLHKETGEIKSTASGSPHSGQHKTHAKDSNLCGGLTRCQALSPFTHDIHSSKGCVCTDKRYRTSWREVTGTGKIGKGCRQEVEFKPGLDNQGHLVVQKEAW